MSSWPAPPPMRQLPEGQGVSIPRVGIVRTGKKALQGVKRGLGFLVGLEVPRFEERLQQQQQQHVIDADYGGEGWENDLNQLLNG